jgi:hypothetical protein
MKRNEDDAAAVNFKELRAQARETDTLASRRAKEKRAMSPHDARRDPRMKRGPERTVQLNVTVQSQVKDTARLAKIEFGMTMVEFVELAILELAERLRKEARGKS